MTTQQVILATTVVATGALVQQRLVGYDGKTCTKGALAFGIAEVDASVGDAVSVNVLGIIAAEAGAAVTAGEPLQSDENGCVIPLETTGTPARVGVAVTAAAAAGASLKVMWGA
ncbi:TPA: capsid cement protein [Salmonella enterica]|uniref:capsid cement protein n=1 Tax=Salmonella sp. SG203 TaxID=2555397 RepID=UPI001C2E81D7